MNRPMATRVPHYPDKLERADDEAERVVRELIAAIVVAVLIGGM